MPGRQPGMKGAELATYLNARNIPGVRFVPAAFTPTSANYANQRCEGVNLVVIDRNGFDSPELGVELASALIRLYPQQFHIARMIEIMANQSVYDAIMRGEDPRRIADDWRGELDRFQQMRQKYLIYK